MEIYQVRNGQRVWPTCPDCGCRLEFVENGMFINLRHFGWPIDAKGHRCEYIDDEWTFIKGENNSHFGYC